MEDIARWVALDVLDDRQVVGPIDIEGDEGVDARIGGEAATQLRPSDRYRDRVGIEAVNDSGILPSRRRRRDGRVPSMRPVSALSSRSDMRIRLRSGHVKIEQQPEWADWHGTGPARRTTGADGTKRRIPDRARVAGPDGALRELGEVVALEDLADRGVFEDRRDGLGNDRCNRQHRDVVGVLLARHGRVSVTSTVSTGAF